MLNQTSKILRAVAIGAGVAVLSGCAATAEEPGGDIARMVEDALSRAQAAEQAAAAAQATADQALATAQSSETCCLDNKARIDRMFEKAMTK